MGLTLSFALITLTHLPTLITTSCFIGVCLVARLILERERPKRGLVTALQVGGAGVLAMSLTAFYWLPAVQLLSDVSPEQFARDGMEATSWLFFDGKPEHTDIVDFALAVKAYLVLGTQLSSPEAWEYANDGRSSSSGFVSPVITTWFVTPLSYPIWAYAPVLPRIQFPYRFLIVFDLGLGLAFLSLASAWFEDRSWSSKGPFALFGLIFLLHNYGWAYAFSRTHFPPEYQAWHDEGRALRFGTLEYQPASAVSQCQRIMVDRDSLNAFAEVPEVVVEARDSAQRYAHPTPLSCLFSRRRCRGVGDTRLKTLSLDSLAGLGSAEWRPRRASARRRLRTHRSVAFAGCSHH